MNVIATAQFEPEEVEVFVRALQGHQHYISVETERGLTLPVRTFLNRIVQEEPLDLIELEQLRETLDELVAGWRGQTTPEAWREMGAPGADDAVDGLAQERRFAIERVGEARQLVLQASEAVSRASAYRRVTKSERKAVTA